MTKATGRWAANGSRVLALLGFAVLTSAAQDAVLQIDPTQTSVKFTLGDVLHTVNGTFQLERGALQFEPSSGKLSGEIVVNAKSGNSGSGMRDRKMHAEVLESERYPEISFRPDRVEGPVARQGKSSVKVHATVHFTVPYAKWWMKNPSTLFLRVDDSVQIDLAVAGSAVPGSATTHNSSQ
jgi:polyisoprenoid-binding protein YceI